MFCMIDLKHGAQPWGRDLMICSNLPRTYKIKPRVCPPNGNMTNTLPFSCPGAASNCGFVIAVEDVNGRYYDDLGG
jgi:hypothetical protein